MIGSRAWRSLVRRNVLYRKRNWVGTLLELALPIAFVGILVAIKNALGDDAEITIVEPTFPDTLEAFSPLSFQDYVVALQAKRECVFDPVLSFVSRQLYQISGMPAASYDWQVPFVRCDDLQCTDAGNASSFCEYWTLGVAPSSSSDGLGQQRTDAFIEYLYQTYPVLDPSSDLSDSLPFDHDFVQIFDSEQGMINYVTSTEYGTPGYPKVAMGIVWNGQDGNEKEYEYSLRQNSTIYNVPAESARPAAVTTPDTSQLFDNFANNDQSCPVFPGAAFTGPRQSSCTGQYMYNGILTIQNLVGDFILEDSGATTVKPSSRVATNGVRFVPFPTRLYEEGGFFSQIGTFVPLLITIGFLYPVAAIIGSIVREKELRQKELMKMMSVTESDIGWAWFTTLFIMYLIVATAMMGVSTELYQNSEAFLLWIFWAFTCLSILVFGMFIATFSSKTTRAVLIGLILVFVGVFLPLIVDYQTGSTALVGLLSLHPITAMSYGLQEIGYLEDGGVGLTVNTAGTSDHPSGYAASNSISLLILDSILYGVLTWYLNRVIRPDYGQALPLYFPFTLSYWCPSTSKSGAASTETDEDANPEIPIEPVSDRLRAQSTDGTNIEIRGLTKSFGEKQAVDNLSLSMYNGQVTALLGHNGAGKTTTIAMLTGALAPSSGSARVAGKDISSEMKGIRQNIGICLQHDCLFPQMTVREHIQFFARLKGLYADTSHAEAEEHIDQIIKDVALFEKRNTFSKNLSGGMKRKLSVAIAFCGGSNVVLLDEPTSGMDPFSRRFTWNVIRQYRANRCILLTTHFMDEADVLGDRIAIMAEGSLRCLGSPLFLKNHYGVGYQLTIEKDHAFKEKEMDVVKEEKENGTKDSDPEIKVESDLDEVLDSIVTNNVKEANMLSNVGSEMSFQLPISAASNFAPMFQGLDNQVEKGTISSYGIGITTLEEVFLLVARGEELKHSELTSSRRESSHPTLLPAQPSMAVGGDGTDKLSTSVRSTMNLEQSNLFGRHMGALLRKRAANFRRDKCSWCCTTVLPSVFVLFGFIIFRFASPSRDLEALPLNLNAYNPDISQSPRNPIAVNNPDQPFSCQPGVCGYSFGNFPFDISETDEFYYLCGTQARLFEVDPLEGPSSETVFDQCSISASTEIVSRITEDGAMAESTEVVDVNETSYSLFETSGAYAASQYGAVFYTHDPSSQIVETGASYNDTVQELCQSLVQNSTYNTEEECLAFGYTGYLIQYNFTAFHVSPTFQALATEGLLRDALDDNDYTVATTIHPLPLTSYEASLVENEDAFTAWFLVCLSFPFIAGAFGTFIVRERETKAKHLQTVAGVEPLAYWLSSYLWDCINYIFPCGIVIILMFAFDITVMITTDRGVVYGVITLLILFGPAAAGFTYIITFFFTSPAVCFVAVIIGDFITGIGGALTVFILVLIGSDPFDPKPNLIDASDILTWILRFNPAFCLARGLYYSINIEIVEFLEGEISSVWTGSVILYDVIFLAWQCIVYVLLAVVIDVCSTKPEIVAIWKKIVNVLCCKCFCNASREVDITTALPEDEDVIAEEKRVLEGGANDDLIVLSQLTKVYDNGKKAVNNVSLGIPPGQVFGLLGINGAGKTTTMQMLTAEFPPTSGDGTLAGFSVSHEPRKTRRRIGYCPQFDAHFGNMTGREHVELYASIKGVPKDMVKQAAAYKLKQVGLSDEDADRLSVGYSGGMKRRLSLANATIGQPQIVFLDEASTGVDPVARREIWQLISDMVSDENVELKDRTSVVLTTHSMEECEALCPRISIMANGRIRALGSAQQLKNKFGQGYQIEMRCKIVKKDDVDYQQSVQKLAASINVVQTPPEGEEELKTDEIFFNLDQAKAGLTALTGNSHLADIVSPENPSGYQIFKNASSPVGATLEELAAFATLELRILTIALYVHNTYSSYILRERQDTKVRYEVNSDNVKISSIFAGIEERKEEFMLDDYGVSQTSLEQVFNQIAEAAEALKQGRNDG
eukprot:CAMPEP_0113451218 /NCGR_PEP_ID=MMETSP0014_2-20120614/6226_1 /TAXON_ID=2857 /ORGANISM="Nitzschia sp." /LENGTH=1987 /DNA_ID=CAMNT_0000342569 /DNA_START=1298 /DNA_END=7261 /DNA_ORIENTATION=- /assembly_acc=CAM_ASM_000159